MGEMNWRKAAEVLLSDGFGIEDISIKLKGMGLKEDRRVIENAVRTHVQTLRDDGTLRGILVKKRKRRVGAIRKDERGGDHQQAKPPEEGDLL